MKNMFIYMIIFSLSQIIGAEQPFESDIISTSEKRKTS